MPSPRRCRTPVESDVDLPVPIRTPRAARGSRITRQRKKSGAPLAHAQTGKGGRCWVRFGTVRATGRLVGAWPLQYGTPTTNTAQAPVTACDTATPQKDRSR